MRAELADQIPPIPGIDLILQTEDREPVEVAAEIKAVLAANGIVTG